MGSLGVSVGMVHRLPEVPPADGFHASEDTDAGQWKVSGMLPAVSPGATPGRVFAHRPAKAGIEAVKLSDLQIRYLALAVYDQLSLSHNHNTLGALRNRNLIEDDPENRSRQIPTMLGLKVWRHLTKTDSNKYDRLALEEEIGQLGREDDIFELEDEEWPETGWCPECRDADSLVPQIQLFYIEEFDDGKFDGHGRTFFEGWHCTHCNSHYWQADIYQYPYEDDDYEERAERHWQEAWRKLGVDHITISCAGSKPSFHRVLETPPVLQLSTGGEVA